MPGSALAARSASSRTGRLLARWRWTAAAWCIASLVYTFYLVASGANLLVRYVPAFAASLPFSIGSMIYYLRDELPVFQRSARMMVVGTFALHASLARVLWRDVGKSGLYVSLGLVALVVAALRSLDERTHPSGHVDHLLGDLSYPLFLCHIHAGALVSWAVPSPCTRLGPGRPSRSPSVSLVLAWVVHRAAEVPLAPLRTRLGRTR